jgi:hypothetical protein
MLTGLMNLLLLETALTVGCSTHTLPLLAQYSHGHLASTKTLIPTTFFSPAPDNAVGDCDCLDPDNSDESSSSQQRPRLLGATAAQQALALIRSKLRHTPQTRCSLLFPLYRTFCTLLL